MGIYVKCALLIVVPGSECQIGFACGPGVEGKGGEKGLKGAGQGLRRGGQGLRRGVKGLGRGVKGLEGGSRA